MLGPTSGRIDRIVKVREYAAVPSIRRYVLVEFAGVGVTVLERTAPGEVWRTTVLTGGDALLLPEIGIEIPVGELYEGLSFPEDADA